MTQEPPEETILTIKDLLRLLFSYRRFIVIAVLFFGLWGAIFPLTKPIKYQAQATFMDRGTKSVSVGSGLLSLVGGGGGASAETSSLLQSRALMNRVVEKLKLHVQISDPQIKRRGKLDTIRDNFRAYRAIKEGYQGVLFPDQKSRLAVEEVEYHLPYSIGVSLRFLDSEKYAILGSKGEKLGEGRLDQLCNWKHGTLTLTQTHGKKPVAGEGFGLSLTSVDEVSRGLVANIKAKPDPEGAQSLLFCHYQNKDRNLAVKVLNTALEELKSLLFEEGKKLTQFQLDYLENRCSERSENMAKMMYDHADLCAQDLVTTGFMDSGEHLDFLKKNQSDIKQRLLSIELEMKRLSCFSFEECVHYDHLGLTSDSNVINNALNRIRSLRQQRDAIALAPEREKELNVAERQELFCNQIAELEKVQEYSKETRSLLASLDAGELPNSRSLLEGSDTLIPVWLKRLKEGQQNVEAASLSGDFKVEDQWKQEQQSFGAYLRNMERIFAIREEMLQERLIHQRNPRHEFRGISLSTAGDLYLQYTRDLDDLDLRSRENDFLIKQVKDPKIELVTLTGCPKDVISEGIIAKVSDLHMQLHNNAHKSEKELERIRKEMAQQREYLLGHLEQSSQVFSLRKGLVLDKIDAIQSIQLDLIHQQISVEAKDLNDYIATRIGNLNHERDVQLAHLNELEREMAQIPEKWVSERLLNDKLDANQSVVLNMTQLVESKVIQKNLETIQSAILDPALPPLLPIGPKIKLFTVVGVLVGAFLGITGALVMGLARGVPVSPEAMRLQQMHVSGKLSSKLGKGGVITDRDLATLRRLSSHCSAEGDRGSLLLVEGEGPHYASDLAALLSNRGERILVVPLDFEGKEREEGPGILQVIEGKAEKPQCISENGYDRLVIGGASRYGHEIVRSSNCRKLFVDLKKKYDRILFYSRCAPQSAEVEAVLSLGEAVAVTVRTETLDQLSVYRKLRVPVSFLFRS